MSDFVLGFMFDRDHRQVALIRKQPRRQDHAWQNGLLNGIGGGIEPNEYAVEAMVREFAEETGELTTSSQWKRIGSMGGHANGAWAVILFTCVGNLSRLRSVEAEKIEIVRVDQISLIQEGMIENLPWLIAFALYSLRANQPITVQAAYP